MMSVLFITILAVVAQVVMDPVRATILSFAAGVFVYPRTLGTIVQGVGVGELAPADASVTAYGIVVAICWLGFWLREQRLRMPPALAMFSGGIVVALVAAWTPSGNIISGILTLLLACVSWPIGQAVGVACHRDVRVSRFLIRSICGVLALEVGVSLLQLRGTALPVWLTSSGRLDTAVDGRTFGTLGHPANLSKMVFFLLILILSCAASSDAITRTWAFIGVLLSLPATALTISRANTIAIAMLLVLWAVGSIRRVGRILRGLVILALGVSAVFFFSGFADRFVADPSGGARPQLLKAGLKQISASPVWGTGPNNYVNVVGQHDATTALGFPVHNTVLFLVASVGIPLTVLLLWPHALLVFSALSKFRTSNAARVILFSAPGFALIAMTGWALASEYAIIGWFFLAGFMAARVAEESPVPSGSDSGAITRAVAPV